MISGGTMKKLFIAFLITLLIAVPVLVSCGEDETTDGTAGEVSDNSYEYLAPEEKSINETPTIESMTGDKMSVDGKKTSSIDRRYIPGEGLSDTSGFNIHIIPVMGNPVLIESKGQFAILYGAGDIESGEIVRRYLKENNVPALNYLMIPSNIDGTFEGASAILQDIPVGFLGFAGYKSGQGAIADVFRTSRENSVMAEQQKAGAIWNLSGVTFEVLYPLNPGDDDDGAMVIRISMGETSFLLTSQIDSLDEKKMLERGKIQQTDVVIATNGAPVGSMSEVFINALNPKEIIVCGLPDPTEREALPENAWVVNDTVATVIHVDEQNYSVTVKGQE